MDIRHEINSNDSSGGHTAENLEDVDVGDDLQEREDTNKEGNKTQ